MKLWTFKIREGENYTLSGLLFLSRGNKPLAAVMQQKGEKREDGAFLAESCAEKY